MVMTKPMMITIIECITITIVLSLYALTNVGKEMTTNITGYQCHANRPNILRD